MPTKYTAYQCITEIMPISVLQVTTNQPHKSKHLLVPPPHTGIYVKMAGGKKIVTANEIALE